MIAACLGAMLWRGTGLVGRQGHPDRHDGGAWVMHHRAGGPPAGLGLTDPLVHAGFAVCFIGLPQLTLAYKIFTVGGEGMAGLMLLAGHIGISPGWGSSGSPSGRPAGTATARARP